MGDTDSQSASFTCDSEEGVCAYKMSSLGDKRLRQQPPVILIASLQLYLQILIPLWVLRRVYVHI